MAKDITEIKKVFTPLIIMTLQDIGREMVSGYSEF